MRRDAGRRKPGFGNILPAGGQTGSARASSTQPRLDMQTSALALVIALAAPVDTVRAAPDSARVASPVDVAVTIPARLALPVSLELEPDTVPRRRRKSIEVSEWYERRLRIHRYGAYATIPLFIYQAAAGNELYHKGSAADGWARNGHRVGATAVATVFGVNTVTGLWNLWDSRAVEQGRTRRTIHALLMLASDAGFAYAGIKLSEDAEQSAAARRRHRNTAYASMGVAVTGAGMMLLWRD